jgi:hypothetical protein
VHIACGCLVLLAASFTGAGAKRQQPRAAFALLHAAQTDGGTPGRSGGGAGTQAGSPPDRGARLDVADFRYRRAVSDPGEGLVSLQLDAAVVAHSRGEHASFADVRIVDAGGYQIPYLLERRPEPLVMDLTLRPATEDERSVLGEPGAGNRSVHAVTLPYDNLPAARLVLETSERLFRRRLHLGALRQPDRQHRSAWLDIIATRDWQHGDRVSDPEPLELAVHAARSTVLFLIVDEGDNRPLPLETARLLLPSWRARFVKPAGTLWLLYGNDATTAPKYDLALNPSPVLGGAARDVSAAPEDPASAARVRQLSPAAFWIGMVVAVVVLLAVLARLVTSGTGPPPSPPRP